MNGSILKKLRSITSWWLVFVMVFSSFGSLGQVFAAIPTMTATTADNDSNGTVDAITITFSEAVSIADGSSGDGLPSLTLGNGCTIAAGNYASSGTTTLVLSGLTSCTAGNTGITPTISYAQAANCSTSGAICDIATATQMAPSAIVATDRAKPVITAVTLSISYANLLTITYSEPVVFATGASSTTLGNLNDGVVAGIGSFSSSGVVTSTGNTLSGSGNTLIISLATATGGFIPASASLAPSGTFTAFSGTFVTDAAGNPVNTSGSVAVTGSPSWDLTEPVISSMSFIPSTGSISPGGTITLAITADLPRYNPGAIMVNGVTIPASQFTDTWSGQYAALYQVGSGDTSRTAGTIPASVTLLDDARNLSNPFTSVTTNTLSINGSWGTGTGTIDTTPPVISGVSVTATGTVANYRYTVADASNVTSVIYLGTGSDVLGNLFASGSSTGTGTHTGTFSGLTPFGNYSYFIRSVDVSGNTGTTSTGTVTWSGGTGSTNTSTGLAILNSRVEELTSSRATVRFNFTGTGFTAGTESTGTGYVVLSTGSLSGTGAMIQTWVLNISVTGSLQTASASFSGLTADSLYNYMVSLSSGTGNVSATGSFATAGDPVVLTGGTITTQTGATTLTGASVPIGSTLSTTGSLTIISDLRESQSLSGRLTLSGVTGITVSGSTWNGVLLPPSLLPIWALENASLSELSTLIASLNTVNAGITTTYAGNVFQTVKVWGDPGVTLVPAGSNFIVSFVVPSGTGSTGTGGTGTGSVLRIYRSSNGGMWEANTPDATCTLDLNKMCTFSTNHLSFFAPVFITATTSTGSGWTGWGSGGGSSGGWGGSFLLPDNCPGGDTSPSYYDRTCGGTFGTGATGTGMIIGTGSTSWTGTVGTGTVGTGTIGTGSTGGLPLRFTDISNNWARQYIEELAQRGVVDNATFFRPEDDITRAEFLKMSLLWLGISVDTSASASSFTDVSASWQIPLIEKARDMGIVSWQIIDGVSVFRPNDPVTRAEAMKMLLNSAGIQSAATTTEFADVRDAEQIRYIEKARELGIVSGQTIGGVLKFRPNDRMTRAEVSKVVVETMRLNPDLAKAPSYRVSKLRVKS